jgi:hypothetical protein
MLFHLTVENTYNDVVVMIDVNKKIGPFSFVRVCGIIKKR